MSCLSPVHDVLSPCRRLALQSYRETFWTQALPRRKVEFVKASGCKFSRSIMRIAVLMNIAFCTITRANPLPVALPAADRVYMASEHLTASISPDAAELKGTFTFQYRQDVSAPGHRSFVMLEIPIWFPEHNANDPSVEEFWKHFPKDNGIAITATTRAAFKKAVGLRVFLGDTALPVEQFSTLTSTNSRQRWAPREWQQEANLCCLVFNFYIKDDSALVQTPLTISYRQPLFKANDVGRFFYLPVFQNLPNVASTGDTNRYSITVVAQPGCSLTVTNGEQKFTVEAGHSVTLGPKHHQPIRAVVSRGLTRN